MITVNGSGEPRETNGNHFALSIEKFMHEEEPDSDYKKILRISHHFRQIMELLGLDLDACAI
jgi:hypothetical protein